MSLSAAKKERKKESSKKNQRTMMRCEDCAKTGQTSNLYLRKLSTKLPCHLYKYYILIRTKYRIRLINIPKCCIT